MVFAQVFFRALFTAAFLPPARVATFAFAFAAFLAAGVPRAAYFFRSSDSCSRSCLVWSAGSALTRARAWLSQ